LATAAIRNRERTATVATVVALRPIDPTRAVERRIRVRDVLGFPALRDARLVAGANGVDRLLTGINVMQVPTDRFARRGGLLLAAAGVFTDLDDPKSLLEGLVRRRVAGLAIRGGAIGEILPSHAIDLADRRGLPLIELPATTHLDDLMTDLLETLVANQYRALRAASDVRGHLTAYMLAGGGLEGLPDAIAELVDGEVVAFDAGGSTLAASDGADTAAVAELAESWKQNVSREPLEALGQDWVIWPILAGPERLGALAAKPRRDREGVVFAALRHGAANAALQILHEREAVAADARLREGFFRDLLQGSLEAQAAERRAAAIGWQADSYRVLLTSGTELSDSELSERAGGALVVDHGDALLAVLPQPDDAIEALEPALVHAGVSSAHAGLDALPGAVHQAGEALRAARRFDQRARVRDFDDLGPLRMLSHVSGDELGAYHRDVLGPLDAVADDVRANLLQTLELLLDTGLNVAETARRGGWHYNTVRYRVARLSELLGPFVTDGVCLESLQLALLVRAELGTANEGEEDG
jgi:PucR family transcriptional regulator, purine catabolism regulatory protein